MIQRRETLLRFFLLTTSNVDESFASRTNVCLFWRCNSSKNEYWIGLKPSHSSISESASLTTNCGQATIEIDRRSKYCYSYLSYCITPKYMVIDILESYKIPQFCAPTHQTTMCNGLNPEHLGHQIFLLRITRDLKWAFQTGLILSRERRCVGCHPQPPTRDETMTDCHDSCCSDQSTRLRC